MKKFVDVSLAAIIALAILVSPSVAGDKSWFSWGSVKGSGDIITETREVDDFTRIKSTGAFDVYITIGEKPSVTVEVDDNLMDMITTRVRGRTLVLDSEGSYSSRHGCRIDITVPSLERLHCTGSGDFLIENLDEQSFECRLSGSGNMTATGTCEEVEIQLSGSGNIDFSDLEAQYAYARISGSGDIRVYASIDVDARISGSGNIYYYGNPEHADKSVSGSGEVKAMR